MSSCCCCCSGSCCCGGNSLSMSTVQPNASVSQGVSGARCGGASCLTNALNSIGKWGTVLTASIQGKPVATNGAGVSIGAKGTTALPGQVNSTMLIVLVVVVGALLLIGLRR